MPNFFPIKTIVFKEQYLQKYDMASNQAFHDV